MRLRPRFSTKTCFGIRWSQVRRSVGCTASCDAGRACPAAKLKRPVPHRLAARLTAVAFRNWPRPPKANVVLSTSSHSMTGSRRRDRARDRQGSTLSRHARPRGRRPEAAARTCPVPAGGHAAEAYIGSPRNDSAAEDNFRLSVLNISSRHRARQGPAAPSNAECRPALLRTSPPPEQTRQAPVWHQAVWPMTVAFGREPMSKLTGL